MHRPTTFQVERITRLLGRWDNMSYWTEYRIVCTGLIWAWFEASAAKWLRISFFWAITQRVVVISYWHFGTKYRSHSQGSRIQKKTCNPNKIIRFGATGFLLYSWTLTMEPIGCPETSVRNYRVIKKCLCTWWLQYRKLQVMFKVSPACLQTFIDTPNCVLEDCVQYSTVHIPNVFCDGHLHLINYVL